ncbi:MAG: ribosome maturation factor RimM [Solitalea-like symbiont of Tyrophagus putrescentiae]
MGENIDDIYRPIGEISKPKGLKGEVKVNIYSGQYAIYLEESKTFFFKDEGLMVPYFIETFCSNNLGSVYIKIEGINNRESITNIVGKELFASINLLDKFISEDNLLKLDGFSIIDNNIGVIGVVESILRYPQQNLASLSYNGKNILIPLVPDLIVKIDHNKKNIIMALPEGLLEI